MPSGTSVANFVSAISALRLDSCFNPYSDRCVEFDVHNAPEIRRSNLAHVLGAAVASGVEDLWVGLELGYNGGRRTGLAMTDDAHLDAHGRRFGVAEFLRTATRAGPTKELTAGVVWDALSSIERPVFLWNVVPIHPHRPDELVSNRRHTSSEREACSPLLAQLINLLRPKRIVSVGADASSALARSGYIHTPVRHPAFGGKRDFLRQVSNIK